SPPLCRSPQWDKISRLCAAHKDLQAVPSELLPLSQVQRFGNGMTSSERVLFHQFQESLLLGFVESPHADLTEDMISPRFRSFRTLQISNCQIGKQRTNYRAL